jgi:hypothetical protein
MQHGFGTNCQQGVCFQDGSEKTLRQSVADWSVQTLADVKHDIGAL